MPVEIEALRSWFNQLPIVRSLGIEVVQLEPGHALMRMCPEDGMRNPNGAINGALLSALVDQAGGVAVASLSEPHEYPSTMDLSMHFIAAAMRAPITAESQVLRRGRRHSWVSVDVRDAEQALCVRATGTWNLQQRSPTALGPLLPGV